MTLTDVSLLVGFLLCHSSLNTNQASLELWKMALRSGLFLNYTRDEVLNIHKVTEDHFDGMKGYIVWFSEYPPTEGSYKKEYQMCSGQSVEPKKKKVFIVFYWFLLWSLAPPRGARLIYKVYLKIYQRKKWAL